MKTSKLRKFSPVSNLFLNIIMAFFGVCCIAPLILVLSISFTDESLVNEKGYQFIPAKFSLYAYKYVISASSSILNSYMVTIFVTVTGTILSLLITSMFAYPLSRKCLKYRNKISFLAFFTLLFNGGLAPWYILISRYLHLKGSIFALIIPYLVSAWNVLLMRNFFSAIPESIMESASMDGSGELRTFFKIVIPISLPSLATIGLFNTLMYWNDWWLAILFIDDRKLFPLQYLLQSIMTNIEVLSSNVLTKDRSMDIPGETARMALCILAIGPIVLAYPFFQRYFIKGLTVGAIKG